MTSRHYSSDAKEVSIVIVVDFFKIGVKLGVFNIAIYGKTIRCSINYFEQCINIPILSPPAFISKVIKSQYCLTIKSFA